jgi:uncharacterized DUF497 family protein
MSTPFQYTFDWDPNKAVANRRKHGVGFEQAATVFSDPLAVSIYDEDHSDQEERWITLGRTDNGQLLVVVHTHQEVSPTEAAIRLISARTATPHEQRDYEQGR